jgi:two-component system OmpR family response regulator
MATILIVEDAPSLREVWGEALTLNGHRVEVACSGAEALASLESSLPDVLLCDHRLNDIDGFAILRHLRASGAADSTYIIITSGSSELREAALAAGAHCFLPKPFPITDLLDLIERRQP